MPATNPSLMECYVYAAGQSRQRGNRKTLRSATARRVNAGRQSEKNRDDHTTWAG
jgi:hypothetical protein